jgi:hypothetical protein
MQSVAVAAAVMDDALETQVVLVVAVHLTTQVEPRWQIIILDLVATAFPRLTAVALVQVVLVLEIQTQVELAEPV